MAGSWDSTPASHKRLPLRIDNMLARLCAVFLSASSLSSLPAQDAEAARARTTDRLAVLNKGDGHVSILDPATGETVARIPVGEGPHEAATAADGRTIVVCNYGAQTPGDSLTVIDVKEGRAKKTIPLGYRRPHGIQFLPDGNVVAVTAEADQKLLLVDVDAGKVEAAIDTEQATSHMVALGPDGKRAYVANIRGGSVSVIDLAAKKTIKVIPTDRGCEGIAVHPTRAEVWTANNAGGSVSVIDTEELEVVARMPCPGFPIRVAFTRDGAQALVSCPHAGDLAAFDVEERRLLRRASLGKAPAAEAAAAGDPAPSAAPAARRGVLARPMPIGIQVAPDGKTAYVADPQNDQLCVLDLTDWSVARRIATGQGPDGMTWCRF
jgi:YVTN family beta-propeller protein